ncbi:MAG: cytochrome-c peroxidase [Alphaproteobacteria bacterium]
MNRSIKNIVMDTCIPKAGNIRKLLAFLIAGFLVGLFAIGPTNADLKQLPPPLTEADFPKVDQGQVELGRLLFYDPILSGNKNISCATCHHETLASGDGLSLGVGEGGVGLGTKRTPGQGGDHIEKRVPRNAPGLFNVGASQIHTLFHDGRVMEKDTYGNRFHTPAEEFLPDGLDSVLAAQALFPVTSKTEMAGNPGENNVAFETNRHPRYVWPILSARVRAIEDYKPLFYIAFADVRAGEPVTYVHIANALAAFMDFEWRSFDSPFDAYLNGDEKALTQQQLAGMELFYGKAACAQCHEGALLTDQKFHALALPQFGPGRTRRFDPYVRDVGRMGVTDRLEDAYRFRTPSLRNVELTAPYGHNGAYADLRGIVMHHLNPMQSLEQWDRGQLLMPEIQAFARKDFIVFEDTRELERHKSHVDIKPVDLNDTEIDQVLSFLKALTGTDGRLGAPDSVPSGLPLD